MNDSELLLFSRLWWQPDLPGLPPKPKPCQKSQSPASVSSKTPSRKPAKSVRVSLRMVAVSSNGVRIGEDSPVAKYTDAEIDQVFQLRDEGFSFKAIADMLDMPKSTVWAVAAGLMRGRVVDHWERRECRN